MEPTTEELQELSARLTIDAPATAAGEFMFMPAGVHQVNLTLNGSVPVTVQVGVDASGASALNQQLAALSAKGNRPFFDFNHNDDDASFWPSGFSWKDTPAPGIYAEGEWSRDGKDAIEGKAYRSFSAVFHVDNIHAKPAKLVSQPRARLNMGGLVNDPAFKAISPLWAKNADNQNQDQKLMVQTLAELQAKISSLEGEIAGLKTKAGTDAAAAAQLSAKETELILFRERATHATDAAELGNLRTELKARNTAMANVAITAAVKRGAIPAQNLELQARYRTLIEADPSNAVLVETLAGNPAIEGGFTTTSAAPHSLQAKEGPLRVLRAYAELTAKNTKAPVGTPEKIDLARQMGRIFLTEMRGNNKDFAGLSLSAADNTDANLGTLTGTLVAQQCLELFKLQFGGIFGRITTDFSALPAQFLQTTVTRITTVPGVATYSVAADANGRTLGWLPATNPIATDVPITLDEHVGVPIVFNSNILAETMRRLFDEFAPAASYALAKYFIEKLYKKFTLANYAAYAVVNGVKVPVAFASYKVALGNFARTSLNAISQIMNPNEVPIHDRSVLLNSAYFGQLANDPSLVTFFSGQRAPGIITDNELPRLSTFTPIEAPNLANGNATPNFVGMALQKAGALVMSRLPTDYSTVLPGASYGSVTTITDPDSGLAVMLVQFVDHNMGTAQWRIQVMIGAAPGDSRAGLLIQSQ